VISDKSASHTTVPDFGAPDTREAALRLAVIVGIVACFTYGPFFFWMGMDGVAIGVLMGAIPFASAPLIKRLTGSSAASLETINVVTYALITWISYWEGGLGVAPAIPWLLVIPFIALVGGGHRSAAAWLLVVLATLAGFYLWQRASGLEVRLGNDPLLLHAVNAVVLIVIVMAFLALVERTRHRAIANQQALNEVLRRVARDLEKRNEDLARAHEAALAADRAKSQFLANMSHEIRTPMNGVLGMTELLLTTGLTTDQMQYAQAQKLSGEHLLTLINDILDISKLDAGKMELERVEYSPRDMAETVAEILSPRAFGNGLQFYCLVRPDVPRVLTGDPHRLRQVISNLLSNAIKFTDQGEVGLEVHMDTRAGEPVLCLSVRDTGIGISPEVQARLFHPFTQADESTTRRYGGTGLGLTISRRIAQCMRGDVEVTSSVGAGSSFTFWIPLESAPVPANAAPQACAHAGKVVWIHDRRANPALALAAACETLGYSTMTSVEAPTSDTLRDLDPTRVACVLIAHSPEIAMAQWRDWNAHASAPLVACVAIDQASLGMELSQAGIRVLTQPARLDRVERCLRGAPLDELEDAKLAPLERSTLALHVLLAEDNAVNRQVSGAMLKKLGCTFDVALDGDQAVKRWTEGIYDMVLMDCQMPVMDGYDATRRIRQIESRDGREPTPIIAVTANALHDDRAHCLAAGMTDYLSKPFTLGDLENLLRARNGMSGRQGGVLRTI